MNIIRPVIITLALSIVTACGGAGGDSGPVVDNAAIEAVSPYVGLWNLPGNWRNETSDDEAVLVIRSPNTTDGKAIALIYDFDDAIGGMGNCYLIDSEGVLEQSLDDQIFLSLPPTYDSAVADLQPNNELKITIKGTEPERVITATFRGPVANENELNVCAP